MFERQYADPYVIAEIGMNYEGSMERAKGMVAAVAAAGGHAAKFQTYKAATLASQNNSPAYWDTSKEPTVSQYDLFQRFDTFGQEEYEEIASYCKELGLDFLSTPFDIESVDWLSPLMPAVKIASADLTNVPLLRRVARTAKPILLSVGASTFDEIQTSIEILDSAGAVEIVILHCVLNYPTPYENANLLGILELERRFGNRVTVGYSDHVAPTESGSTPALDMAVVLGARVIEKHFTDDRSAQGNDHYHAFDKDGLHLFLERTRTFRTLSGSGEPDISAQGVAVKNARRRIFVKNELSATHVLTEDDLIALRSDTGIEVAKWDSVVGAKLSTRKLPGAPLLQSDIVINNLSKY